MRKKYEDDPKIDWKDSFLRFWWLSEFKNKIKCKWTIVWKIQLKSNKLQIQTLNHKQWERKIEKIVKLIVHTLTNNWQLYLPFRHLNGKKNLVRHVTLILRNFKYKKQISTFPLFRRASKRVTGRARFLLVLWFFRAFSKWAQWNKI